MKQKWKILSTLCIVGVMVGFVSGTSAEAITASQTEVTTADSQIEYYNLGNDSQYSYRTHLVDDGNIWFLLSDANNNDVPVLKKWDGENFETISLGAIKSIRPGWAKLGSNIYFSGTESVITPGVTDSDAFDATYRFYTLNTADNSISKGTDSINSRVSSVNGTVYGGLSDGNGDFDLASYDGSSWTPVCSDNGSGVTWDGDFAGRYEPDTDGSRYFLMGEFATVKENIWVYDTVTGVCSMFTDVADQDLIYPKHPTKIGDELYFVADSNNREKIFKYTPGDTPTLENTDISFPSGNVVSSMTSMNGKLVYSAGKTGNTAIFSSDGTAAGTDEIVDLSAIPNSNTGSQARAHANSLFVLDGVLYFTFFTTDEGEELWAYDNGVLEQLTAQAGAGDLSLKSNGHDDYDSSYVPTVRSNDAWMRAEADSTVGLIRITPRAPAPQAPAPYSGPLISSVGSGSAISALSTETIRVSGERLGSVSGVSVDGKPGEVISVATDHFMMKLPLGLEPGTYDLAVQSSIGNLTYLDAITIVASNSSVDSEQIDATAYGEVSAWTKRISDSQVKVYVKFPTVGEKVRISHQTGGSGSYETVYVKTTSSETMEGLRVVEGVGTYIVRTIDLSDINRIRVTVGDSVEVQVRYNN
jgi:hypothetical protein